MIGTVVYVYQCTLGDEITTTNETSGLDDGGG